MLSEEGKSLSDFKLPQPAFHKVQFIQNYLMDCYVATEEKFSPEKAKLYFEVNHNKLNQDQKQVFDYQRIDRRKQQGREIIFLDAPGGTGKHLHWMWL